jgi:hypothetical protein
MAAPSVGPLFSLGAIGLRAHHYLNLPEQSNVCVPVLHT